MHEGHGSTTLATIGSASSNSSAGSRMPIPHAVPAGGILPLPTGIGSLEGYAMFLAAIADASHPGHAEALEIWSGRVRYPIAINGPPPKRQIDDY